MNSRSDTFGSTSSSKHPKKRQTNTIKQPLKEQMESRVSNTFPQKGGCSVTQTSLKIPSTYIIVKGKSVKKHYRIFKKQKYHNENFALERSVVNYWRGNGELKLALRDPNPSPSASIVVKNHIFVRVAWRSSNSSMNHYGTQINHRYSLLWSKDKYSTGIMFNCCICV